jgi:hypothetical protein
VIKAMVGAIHGPIIVATERYARMLPEKVVKKKPSKIMLMLIKTLRRNLNDIHECSIILF